jgi:dTMP kinase
MPVDKIGKFIVLEGIDGSGKSTQAHFLANRLNAVLTFAPGATDIGKNLRSYVLGKKNISYTAETLLMLSDRALHVDQIINPNLVAGKWVVCDRFNGSTLAYQGYGRGLDITALNLLISFSSQHVSPDLNILLDISVDEALKRQGNRSKDRDRLESQSGEFYERVRNGYLEIAGTNPDSWVVVDGSLSSDLVQAEIYEIVNSKFSLSN